MFGFGVPYGWACRPAVHADVRYVVRLVIFDRFFHGGGVPFGHHLALLFVGHLPLG